jgi:ornithine carbamoyltransferase
MKFLSRGNLHCLLNKNEINIFNKKSRSTNQHPDSSKMNKLRHLTKISDLTKEELINIINHAKEIKSNPLKHRNSLENKSLLMFFEKPSLRTRISFEVAMTQMGGHGIYYNISTSPLGTKENVHDTAKCLSRFCDLIVARVHSRETILGLEKFSEIPVINALDDYAHPCQIICDFLTISEKKSKDFEKLTLSYFGDLKNNVTYDLMRACAILGVQCNVSGPNIQEYQIEHQGKIFK